MAHILSVVSEIATALLMCLYYFVVGVWEGVGRSDQGSDGSKALEKFRTETVNRFDGQLENVNNGDERRMQDGQPTPVTFRRRGDSNRNNLREFRKHQRSMKMKYYENTENLRYFCFYKGLTEQYYQTLRQC